MLGWRSDVLVRPAKSADAGALSKVFAEAWRGAYAGIIPDSHLEAMIRRRNRGWWKKAIDGGDSVLVIVLEGKTAGYATYGAARLRGQQKGEIYELYILPSYQGVGLGEHLFEACRARLDARGFNGLIVWALADNGLAQDFYWRRGGRPTRTARETFGPKQLGKVAFSWP